MPQGIAGRYTVHEPIGSGGMGTVFRADDCQSGQPVALKRLNPDILLQDATLLERFRREAEILRQLNHPGIVRVYDTFEADGHHYIVMEYIAGGSLRQMLDREKRLPRQRALLLALDLADALTRAHRLDVVHRDLKPANVLIADDGTPRLTDFGVARMGSRERVTDSGAVIGTLDYLSPEALNGETVDGRADIWAFGVMLYEMLSGERPFKGDSVGQTITAILTQPVPRLEDRVPDCPMALIDLIERMLDKDPAQRLPGIRLAGAEIEALLRHPTPATANRPPAVALPETGRFETPTPNSGGIPNNLPAQMTPFIGRDTELTELTTLLAHPANRLLTVIAPGGMGKTSLTLELARRLMEGETGGQTQPYRHGIFVTLLAPLSETEHIVPAIAGAIGLQFGAGSSPQEQLIDYLREKRLLLVLDNFEHLLAGVGIVTEILQAAPNVKIVATSRERLNLSAETLVHLGGMDFPEWETPDDALRYSAVKLFMQSARRVRPDFELTADDLPYVARICRLTGGTPLAIVLAAAWVEMLTPAQIAAEISKSLDFLESDLRDLPERQRSMRATFEYSWNLLDETARQVFPKLSIFRGGFTFEAAQAVAGIGLRGLMALVNKSLLQRNVQTGRFDVHELVRQYAEERLTQSGEAAKTQQAHAAYFANFLSSRWEDVKGKRQIEALHEIDPEFENIRAAWQHQPWQSGSETLMNMVKSFWWYSDLHNRTHDTFDLMERALVYPALASSDPAVAELRELMRGCYAWVCVGEGTVAEGLAAGQQAVAALETNRFAENLIVALMGLWLNANYANDIDLERYAAQRCVDLGKQSDNDWVQAHGKLFQVASLAFFHHEESYSEAMVLQPLLHSVNDRFMLGMYYLYVMGSMMIAREEYDAARPYLEKGLHYFEELGQAGGQGRALQMLAQLTMRQQDYPAAIGYHRRALRIFTQSGQIAPVTEALVLVGSLLIKIGKSERAVELYIMIQRHLRTTPLSRDNSTTQLDGLKTQLSPDVYAAAVERGKRLTLDEAVTRLVENEDW